MRESRHEHGVPGELAHVTGAQLPHLGSDTVLLHQGFLETGRAVTHRDLYMKYSQSNIGYICYK